MWSGAEGRLVDATMVETLVAFLIQAIVGSVIPMKIPCFLIRSPPGQRDQWGEGLVDQWEVDSILQSQIVGADFFELGAHLFPETGGNSGMLGIFYEVGVLLGILLHIEEFLAAFAVLPV